MKTKFSRRAKSAVSILLTLCMILSVFTIAISSASAATAEDESVGKSEGISYKRLYFGVPISWTESFSHLYAAAKQTNGFCVILGELTESTAGSRLYVNATNPNIKGHSNWGTENAYFFATNTSFTIGEGYNNSAITSAVIYDTGVSALEIVNELNNSNNNYFFYSTTGATTGGAIEKKCNNYDSQSYLVNTSETFFKQSVSCSAGGSATVASWDFNNFVRAFGDSTVKANSSSSEVYSIAGSKVTVTASANKGYVFEGFYSDSSYSTPITSGVSGNVYTYNSKEVKTVYVKFELDEPKFCLVGNDIRDDAFTINDVTPAKVTPDSDHNWFNTWQPAFAVNNPVSSGVYSITFTVKEDFQWQADVGIMNQTDGQRAFYYDGREYNTAGDNIDVPDAGISDGLYVYPLAELSPGGSLNLKKGQTYTITIDQTKRLNADAPWGKITIEAKDAYVDTVAKKIAYNPTERRYDAVSDAAKTIGTVSSEPYHGKKGDFTSTLTATKVNNNYTFTGWFTNEACTGTAVSTSATYDVEDPDDSVTYYALFTQAMPTDYNVAITDPGGTISLTGGVASTGTSASTAYAGATVGLKIENIDHDKEFKSWKITSTQSGYDVTSSVLNAGATASSASFTMPPYDVTVTAVLGAKTPVSITVTSNDNTRGTASYTENTYYVGDEIQLSATNGTGVFTKWQITGANFKTGSTATKQNPVIIPTGTTVTAKAFFDYKTYQLYYKNDRYLPMIRQSDGTYVSTHAISYGTDKYFTIYDANDRTYAIAGDNPYELHSGHTTGSVSSWNAKKGNQYRLKSGSSSYYVIFDPAGNSGTGTVSIIDTDSNPMGTIATIYAKDGSIRYANGGKSDGSTLGDDKGDLWEQSTGGPTCNRGTTKVTKIDNTVVKDPDTSKYPSTNPTLTDHLKQYSAPYGSTITIQTTLNDTYKEQGFEVGMFVVNGWKVAATKTSDGVYTATYTLSSDYAVNNLDGKPSFEITPVYYNSNFKYITFYVDADSVPSRWKGTISACATYANTTGAAATNAHFEGTYPGQPFGREGDLYELKVAKYYYEWAPKEAGSSEYEWKERSTYIPNATITAYNYDSVHHYYYVYADDNVNTSNNKNYQTYDYADFSYLAQIEDIEAILFRCKDTSNDNSAGLTNYNLDYGSSLTYEVLTDYYGNPIDALGNRIPNGSGGYYTAEDAASWTCNNQTDVKIVSSGNANTSGLSTRTKGKWSTYWTPYYLNTNDNKHAITMKTTPADFIDVNFGKAGAAADRNIPFKYANGTSTGSGVSDLEYKRTFIAYDKERENDSTLSGDSGNTGIRIDGQWYYSAKHDFTSNVKVACVGENDAYVLETDTNSANNTGFIGGTSGTKATLDGNTTHTYNNVTTNATLNCTVGSGYTFVGWFIYDGTKYTKIGDNYADLNTTMLMKKNYTIVAVVKEVGSGDLVITHSRYTGSKPEAHTGTGKYYVSAKIYDSNGTTLKRTIAEAQNSIIISELLATDKIQITLRTVCDGADTFYAWYEEALGENYARTGNYYEICDENKDPLGESQVSYEFFQADCSTFFNGDTLTRKTLDFYSDIIHVSAFANLTYKYYDRFAANGKGNMVSYTVKNVELTPEEISNGYIPGDDKITKYAPNVVDTIYTDTKWYVVGTKVERMASNVTLMATQVDKECYVQYIPYDNVGEELLQDLSTETGVNGVAEWTNTKVPFNSWLVNGEKDMSNWDPSDFIVSAPQTYSYTSGGTTTTWTFVRFDVYAVNRTSGAIGDLIYSSNDNIFGYRIYADCAIYPVYEKAEVTKKLTAKIEPAVLNREVYGDSTNPTDRLYADLIISFMNLTAVSDGPTTNVIKEIESTSGFTIETGVILDKSVNLSSADYNTLKTAGAAKGTDTTATVIASYNTLIGTEHVTALAANDTAYTGLAKYKVKDNSDMTNKNRIDKVLKFTNSTTSGVQKKVYFAYSYIVIKKNDSVITTAISAPQKFNFAYIGNKPLETVSGS